MHSRGHSSEEPQRPSRSRFEPRDALVHPVWWTALVALIINDHVIKDPGLVDLAITGKLGALTGILVAASVLAALVRVRTRAGWPWCLAAIGLVLSVVNLVPAAGMSWTNTLGAIGIAWRAWFDSSDLVAVPLLAASWFLVPAARARRAPPSTLVPCIRRLTLFAGSLAFLACSPSPVAKPAVVDGRVLVEHRSGVLFVVDSTTGAVTQRLHSAGRNDAPPAIYDRVLYQTQDDGCISGIHIDNPQTPFTLWKRGEHGAVRILRVDAHRVYALSQSGTPRLYAIDRVFGATVWSMPITDWQIEDIAVDGDALVFSDDENVRCVNARTGRLLWSFDASQQVGTPVVHQGVAYVVGTEGVARGLTLSSGREVWRYHADGDACSDYAPRVYVGSGSLFACVDGATQAIDLESKTVRWTNNSPVVAVTQGVALLLHSTDTLVGADAMSGQTLWTKQLSDAVRTRPVVGDGVAYVRNRADDLYAVDVTTGAVRWTLAMQQQGQVVAIGATSVVVGSN